MSSRAISGLDIPATRRRSAVVSAPPRSPQRDVPGADVDAFRVGKHAVHVEDERAWPPRHGGIGSNAAPTFKCGASRS